MIQIFGDDHSCPKFEGKPSTWPVKLHGRRLRSPLTGGPQWLTFSEILGNFWGRFGHRQPALKDGARLWRSRPKTRQTALDEPQFSTIRRFLCTSSLQQILLRQRFWNYEHYYTCQSSNVSRPSIQLIKVRSSSLRYLQQGLPSLCTSELKNGLNLQFGPEDLDKSWIVKIKITT